MKRYFLFMIAFLCCTQLFAYENTNPKKINHVIYVTFDGTRWQDIYLDHTFFKKFWEKHAGKFSFYGAPDDQTYISVASIPISLPSYQSQMSGSVQPCSNNRCGRITVQTFPENIKEKLKLNKQDIAVFASWSEIANAAEHIEGTIFINAGNEPAYHPITGRPDNTMYQLNLAQSQSLPGGTSRLDQYTFAQALHYFEQFQPVFMWIAFNDADHAAHQGDLDGYHAALTLFDNALDQLLVKLKEMAIDDQTLIIVTTDHGRGDGIFWKHHGPNLPASEQTWAFVMNGKLTPISQTNGTINYNTLSVRPTIENALNI